MKSKIRFQRNNNRSYIECLPNIEIIHVEQDALDLLALCEEHDTNLLLLHHDNVSPAFFDLKSGLAGTILQKFVVYSMKVAMVIHRDRITNQKFKELIHESNKGPHFRFFETTDDAVDWLTSPVKSKY
jgi:hypothetical protein